MKCVQVVGQGIPVRMSNADAFELVERQKDGQYCPKRVWKDHYDNSPSEEYRTRLYCRIDSRNKIVSM